jgi:eukaryotic-like serine/threonine-protein kinase
VAPPVPSKAAPPAAAAAPAGAETALGAFYVIQPKDVLPAFSGKAVTACRAFDRRMPADSFVALICSGEVVPRLEAMGALRGFGRAGMLTLKDFGPIDGPDGRQRLAVIYSAPGGGRFALTTAHKAWQVVDALLKPAASALAEIHSHGAVHRAIRPDNLYLREPGVSTLTLGPSVAVPPGFEQPDIYEPLETAMADPTGRAAGGPKHDMFALGMTALAMLLGHHPGNEYDRDELMIRRIELGSLQAVAPLHTLPRELVDALQGLTADDESERWTLADLNKWLNAGRPDQPRLPDPVRPVLAYTIGGKQVKSARALAYMLGRNWQEAVRQLGGDALQRWVRDHAPERMTAALLDRALVDREPDAEAGDSDALTVTRAITALDPEGPIRYRGLAVDPHGLGPFLFDAAATPEKRTAAAGILRYTLAQKVMDRRVSARRPDRRRATRQAINYERLRRWVLSQQPWEGYERCLYDININLPCLSPMTGGRWVSSVVELIKALDDAASSGRVTEPVLDSHVAAFIASRFDASGDALLTLMKPKDADDDATLGAIRLFAELQQTYGGAPLPGIALWCAKLARRVAEGFHHRPTRQLMLETIDRAQQAGGIAPILKAVDSPSLKSRDSRAYTLARSGWMRLQLEATMMERAKEMRRERAWRRGRDNAAFAAGAGSLLAMFITLFLDSAK